MSEKLDLEAIKAKWLQQCGFCDAGLPMACTCPSDDHRAVILELVGEIEDLRKAFTLTRTSRNFNRAEVERLRVADGPTVRWFQEICPDQELTDWQKAILNDFDVRFNRKRSGS